jgi:glutamate--cysteine ligase
VPSRLPAISLQEARDQIQRRCFDGPAEQRVGVELELFPLYTDGWTSPVPLSALEGTLDHAAPLPGGSRITFEPGGQVELSSQPFGGVDEACAALLADVSAARDAVAGEGVRLVATGSNPLRSPVRVKDTPRYRAMETYFDAGGHHGRTMMCSTAAVQVNVGLGPAHQVAARWRLAHAIGPTMVAAFANSPWLCGRPTGWRSSRMATWFAIDPTRTAPPAGDYATYALDARVMLVRGSPDFTPLTEPFPLATWLAKGHALGWPTADDVDYHLTTLFPPVRPKGWLEVRYLDAVPEPWWSVAAAVVAALLVDETAAETASQAVLGTEGRWLDAARWGLKDEALRASAVSCFTAAVDALARMHPSSSLADDTAAYLEMFVAQSRSPADELAWV